MAPGSTPVAVSASAQASSGSPGTPADLGPADEAGGAHRFVQFGGRFSVNAWGPSLASSDWNTTPDSSLSIL